MREVQVNTVTAPTRSKIIQRSRPEYCMAKKVNSVAIPTGTPTITVLRSARFIFLPNK